MDYLQKLENGNYAEKATLKAITTILPNNFEFQTVLVASDWRRFDRRPLMKDSSGDEVRTDAVTLSKSLTFA